MSAIIELPFPDRNLHPNSRCHWREKAKSAKQARLDGFYATKAADRSSLPVLINLLSITATIYPPDKRKRDDDGMIASLKSYRDGIFDCLGIDDHNARMQPIIWGMVVEGGKVEIVVEASVC